LNTKIKEGKIKIQEVIVMEKIGIFYGTTMGTTQMIAEKIASKMGEYALHNISEGIEKIENYNLMIFGTNTWGYGDIQDDWAAVEQDFRKLNLEGKKIALYGTGDQSGYPDTFVDGIGIIRDWIMDCKGEVVGFTSVAGYEFTASKAKINSEFCGLVIDEINQNNLTDKRINEWIEKIKTEFGK
jgi:flavodoxin I